MFAFTQPRLNESITCQISMDLQANIHKGGASSDGLLTPLPAENIVGNDLDSQ